MGLRADAEICGVPRLFSFAAVRLHPRRRRWANAVVEADVHRLVVDALGGYSDRRSIRRVCWTSEVTGPYRPQSDHVCFAYELEACRIGCVKCHYQLSEFVQLCL